MQEQEPDTRFQALFSSSKDGIVYRTLDGVLQGANDAYVKLTGYSRRELFSEVGYQVLTPAEYRDAEAELIRGVKESGEPVEYEKQYVRKDGSRVPVLLTVFLIKASDGEPLGLGAIVKDVTERKKSQDRLRFQAQVLANVQHGVIVTDTEGRITYWNEGATSIFGYEESEMLGKTPAILYQERDKKPLSEFLKEISGEKDYLGTREGRRKDGTSVWIDVRIAVMRGAGGEPIGFIGVSRDITDRIRAERALRDYVATFQELSREVLEIQEAERRKIARDFHDEIGHALAGIKLSLEMAKQAGGPGDVLADVQAQIGELMRSVRELMLELRPSMLDDFGLLAALLAQLRRYTERTGIKVGFLHEGLEERRFGPDVETAVYRIVQEALTNAAKHARGTEIELRIAADSNAISVLVQDNGIGCEPASLISARRGSGLSGMYERARLLGGRVSVEAQHGAGVCVKAWIPIADLPSRAADREHEAA